jgi:hypothetical protein
MHVSKIVEVDGIFIGATLHVPDADGWRFVSTDQRADAADGAVAPTLADAQKLAKRAFLTTRKTTTRVLCGGPEASVAK